VSSAIVGGRIDDHALLGERLLRVGEVPSRLDIACEPEWDGETEQNRNSPLDEEQILPRVQGAVSLETGMSAVVIGLGHLHSVGDETPERAGHGRETVEEREAEPTLITRVELGH
jgi:hypothetical protein